jgi:Family of unknown function (DUF5330)
MFLIRAAFWLTIVVLLIPGDSESQAPAPRVSILQALSAAELAVHDISRICEREPVACQTGSNALGVLGQKLRYGTELLTKYMEKAPETDGPANVSNSGLRPEEIRIPWQKPAPDKSA